VDEYNFSVTSRRNYMRAVKRCLNWSVKQGLIDQNPAQTLEIPSGESKDTFFTARQVETLLKSISHDPRIARFV